MKFSLLVILTMIIVSPNHNSGRCVPCSGDIFLFDGGFTGQIHILESSSATPDPSSCETIALNTSSCILSFDTDSPVSANDASSRFSNFSVWLLKNASDNTLQITVKRNSKDRPKKSVCLVSGRRNLTQTREMLKNCIQTATGTEHSGCADVSCVNPDEICAAALYKNCSGNASNSDVMVSVSGASPKCYKCGSAFQKTEGHIRIPNITLPNKDHDSNSSYSDMTKNVNKMILKLMENKSSVSVSLNEVTGIFVKQEKTEDLLPFYFMFSSQSEFRIIEDKTQLVNFNRTFSIPKEAFERASNLSTEVLFASLLRFQSFPQDKNNSMLLSDEVYSIDMGAEISNLTENPFNLTFRSVHKNSSALLCSSWNGQGATPKWTTDGCSTLYIDGGVTCLCQHLTFFAVLMTVPPTNISTSDINSLTYLTSIGCGLSLFFLSIGLFMHFLLRRGRACASVHILINLFMALFLLNLSFLVNESVANTGNVFGCKLMAGTMHYCMLSAFTWFGLQALHLCLHLSQNVNTIQNYILKLCVTGWVPPAFVVSAIFLAQKYGSVSIVSDTGKSVAMCWIMDVMVHYAVNISYYSVIFLFTFLTFVLMLRWLYLLRRKSPTVSMSGKSVRPSDALTIMGLCCILGLSWSFAFFAYGPMQIPAYYIFSILNSCQGVFLFVYYYNSSRLVGGVETSAEESSSTTVVENPYHKPK